MSKETLVTREAVFAAAAKVASNGKEPTWLLVRQELGGGSARDICPLLAEWKSQRDSESKEARSHGDPEVERIVRETTERLSDAVRRAFEKRVEIERRVTEQRVKEALSDAGELATAVAASQAEIVSLDGRLREAAEALTTERARCSALERQLSEQNEQRMLAEAKCGEVRTQVQDLIVHRDRLIGTQEAASRKADALHNELSEVRQALEKERVERGVLESAGVQLRQQIDELSAQLQELRAEQVSAAEQAARSLEVVANERDEAKRVAAELAGEALVLRSQARTAMASLRKWMAGGETPRDVSAAEGAGEAGPHGH